MNSFIGCEPEALHTLSERIAERALEIIETGGRILEVVRGTDWTGPDAQEHSARTDAVHQSITQVGAQLRTHADQLRQEADQQEAASRPDPAGGAGAAERSADPLRALRSELPWGRAVKELGSRAGRLVRPSIPQDPGPWIGGPFQHPIDPVRRARDPLPAGESYALEPEHLENAEEARRSALAVHPATRLAQGVLDAHETWGASLDRAERTLVDSGLEELTPLVSIGRIPHEASSLVFGERSAASQVISSAEHLWANAGQTRAEITEALGRGDLAGAIRAGERGIYRHVDGVIELATAPSFAQLPATSAEMLGHAGDAVEAVHPGAAEPLRRAEQSVRGLAEGVENVREDVLDSEDVYDARRRAVPLPWDPR
ncbi:WXG100 family type VII secretion target [Brachybacterium sp. YJGR34]|uniref:WXG100 family type VII secretion target n=1 Tax=Brachybacterium sp. YJGR34 TaxID=2059911 RepID=UPI000E0AAD46|nr:hypothetical protein [Brachybacterium sp. YJGR34]